MGRSRIIWAFALAPWLWIASAAAAETTVTGEIKETGFTGIILKGPDGASVKYWTGRETGYSPSDWRPMPGDTVSVTYYARTSDRGETKLVATQLKRIKAGPVADLVSPVQGTIREVGRTGIIVHLAETGNELKFATGRATSYVPAGYRPAAGERVKITFTRKPSRWGRGYAYIADVVEKR